MKRKFWIVTADHSGVPLGLHMKDQGEDVCLAMIRPEDKHGKRQQPKDAEQAKEWAKKVKYLTKNAEGLLPKRWLPECMKDIGKDDYVIADQIYGHQFCDTLRRRGFKVLGGSEVGYKLEIDRDGALKFLKRIGFDLPQQQKFGSGSAQTAIKFLSAVKDGALYVLKSDNPLVITQVAHESNEELIQKLQAEASLINSAPFLLQEKVDGLEAATETWYVNGKPIFSNLDLEDKRKYNEDSECQVGCSFTLLMMLGLAHPLREMTCKPFDDYAAKNIGTGLMDLSFILDKKMNKIWALEVCGSRFPYNALYNMLALLRVPLGDFFAGVLDHKYKGDMTAELFNPGYAASLRLFNDGEKKDQLITFPKEFADNVWLWDAYKKDGKLYTVGDDAFAIITATSTQNPEAAFAELRKLFFKVQMPSKWARADYDDDDEPGLPLYRYHKLEELKLV